MSVFDNVPGEVLCTIFSHMDSPTKVIARSVCWSWSVILDRQLRAKIILSNETFDTVQRSKLITDTLTVRDLTCDIPGTASRSKLAKNAKHLIFEASSDKLIRQNENYSTVVTRNMSKIVKLNPNVETLIFEEKSLKLIKRLYLHTINLNNLTSLGIDLSYIAEPEVYYDLSKLKLPKLKSVQLTEYWSEYEQENPSGYLAMYTLLANNKKSLRCVTLVHPMRRPEIVTFEPLLPSTQLEALRQDLSELNLTSLYIYFVSVEGVSVFNLGFHLLSSQTSLQKLQVAVGGNFLDSMDQVKRAIRRNSSTLSYLSILSHERWGVYMNLSNTLDPISTCSKLEILEVDHFFVAQLPMLPRSIKNISISGYLIGDGIFPKIDNSLVHLEQFTYTDMSMYSCTGEDIEHFRRILDLPKILKIRLFKQFVSLPFQDFLSQKEGVTWTETQAEVTFRHNYLPYYDIDISH